MSLAASLAVLIEDGIIDEVLGRIMSGKEAEVYAVRYQGHAVAAKVYKAREHRSFKNTAAYTEGRAGVRDTRSRRALEKRSTFGKSLAERGWKDMEHQALQLAFHVGVRVPRPILLYENVLLMELILDEEEQPAPRMSDLSFDADQAVALYKDAFEQIRLLLSVHRIHGNLSPYNILMGVKGPTVIDMPQAIDAAANLRAEEFLERDVRNVTEYLARFAPQLQRYVANGRGLWQHYRLGTLDAADPLEVAQAPPVRRRGGRGERDPRPGQPERIQRSDGRVEVVFSNPGSRGGQRGGRGLSRDGRAQGRAAAQPSAPPQAHRREEAHPPDRGPRRDDRSRPPPRPPQPQRREEVRQPDRGARRDDRPPPPPRPPQPQRPAPPRQPQPQPGAREQPRTQRRRRGPRGRGPRPGGSRT